MHIILCDLECLFLVFCEWFSSFITLIWCVLSLMSHQAVNYHCLGNNMWQEYGVGANDGFYSTNIRPQRGKEFWSAQAKTWVNIGQETLAAWAWITTPVGPYITKSKNPPPPFAAWQSSLHLTKHVFWWDVYQSRPSILGHRSVDGRLPPS